MTRTRLALQPLRGYLEDALRILALNLRLSREEEPACYRVVASQLRLLLCDTTRQHGKIVDISLAGRVFPNLRLPPLRIGSRDSEQGDPGMLTRPEWLAQLIQVPEGKTLTVREIIRLACDHDGGAHVDLPAEPLPDLRDLVLSIGTDALAGLKTAAGASPANS